jgi:CelD/BcsL family acetyltransferase involved in cellulose biosynthesis
MADVRLKKISELSDADWSLWINLQQRESVYESPYFRPEFTRAVAAVRSDVEVAVLTEQGQTVGYFPFQRGKFNLGKPVGGKLSDYHGAIVPAGTQFDARAFLSAAGLATWDFDHLVDPTGAFAQFTTVREDSPQMDLSQGFAAYSRQRREAKSDAVHRQGQKNRKLAREVGPLNFTYDSDGVEAYDLMRRWKSEQLIRTGLSDIFAFPWTLALIAKLRQHRTAEFSAPLTVLHAGDKIAAVTLSLRCRGILHSWFTTYNPELSPYSPGLGLFVLLAEQAEQLGIRTIDLGRGIERYKTSLANKGAPVCEGSLSTPSLATLLRTTWRHTRDFVTRSPLASSTKLLKPLRAWLAYH